MYVIPSTKFLINSTQILSLENVFDFPSLPYVCQKRFAEISDQKTLIYFASINALTRNLSKRCHIIKRVDYIDKFSSLIFIVSCFCKKNEYCNGAVDIEHSSIKKFNEASLIVSKWKGGRPIRLQPFTKFDSSTGYLQIQAFRMDLDQLKRMITPKIKSLKFIGGIESDCSLEEFIGFIKSLSKLEYFEFALSRLHSVFPFISHSLIDKLGQFHNLMIHQNFFIVYFVKM